MKLVQRSMALATLLLAGGALGATSIAGHQAQASQCKAAFTRARAAASDDKARTDAAVRAEECLVQADDGVLPVLSKAAGDSVDVPNAVQTYRDAATAFCNVLSEKGQQLESEGQHLARAGCVADRESELARIIDDYAVGGQPSATVKTGCQACDDAFKGKGAADPASWEALASCAAADVKAKVPAFVPKYAEGDPLGSLSHSPEQIALTFGSAIAAGNGVCDVLAATQTPTKDLIRARCRASVAANVAKAVADRAR